MKHKHSTLKFFAALVCAALVFVGIVAVFRLIEDRLDTTDVGSQPDHMSAEELILHNGAYYAPKKDLDTLLLLGVGGSEEGADSAEAVFLALLISDSEQETITLLHIDPDTVAELPIPDDEGVEASHEVGRLASAYAYGTDDRMRCRSVMKAVEGFLGVEIDRYLSLSMEAVAVLNDSVGGVTLQLTDDCTFLDESYVKDAVVNLKGEEALDYILKYGDRSDRAARQKQYFRALFAQIRGGGMDVSVNMLLDLKQYVSFDGTLNQMTGLVKQMKDYAFDGIESLEGEAVIGEEGREYHPDDQAVKETVIRLFYTPVEK